MRKGACAARVNHVVLPPLPVVVHVGAANRRNYACMVGLICRGAGASCAENNRRAM